MDSGERGTVRMLPEDAVAAKATLASLNVRCEEADVLLVDVPNRSGAFQNICNNLWLVRKKMSYESLEEFCHAASKEQSS